MKSYLELPKAKDYKVEAPKPCGYNWAIGVVAVVFVAACVLVFGACIKVDFSWDAIVLSTVVIIVLAVMTFYMERALFVARKEKLAAYRELEKKQIAVYGKLLDAWLVENQMRIVQEKEQGKGTPEQPQVPKNKEREERERKERELQDEFEVNGVKFKIVYVEGGTFMMGATEEQRSEADNDEKPAHEVTLDDYYIGETVVTQELWKAVMGNNPSNWKGDKLPVEQVSWEDVQVFIKELNGITGRTFRLPTEAEWEYAARGGKKSKGYKYSGSNKLDEVAWYDGNSGDKTHPVKGKKSNELGLYDMSGNVWEWCQDWFGRYSGEARANPQGASSGAGRVYRGGSWCDDAGLCRVSDRNHSTPMRRINCLGFRMVCL